MNKTKIRVLSMVLTVFMLVSMLTGFAVASAAPFATAYECAITVEGVPQIAKTALLVDTTITEEDGATVTRSWDGAEYTFVVGTNAFKALTDAYAYAKANSISRPDIIVTGWDGTDLTIEAESNVYGPNWNTAPMNEMGDMTKVGIKSNGEDWTANSAYTQKEIKIGSIIVKGSPSNWVGVYGFTITKYITLGKERGASAAYIEYLIRNCKMAGVETNTNILTGYGNTDVSCKDVVTFENFWLDTIGGTSDGASRFFGDNTRHLPHIVFDGLYIDFSKADLGFKKINDHLKSYFANSSMTFKNSNLRRNGSGNTPYWNLAQRNDGTALTRELYYDNSTLFNTNQNGGFIYIADGTWSTVSVTNNFIVATTANATAAMPLFITNGSDQGIVNDKTYTITGNRLLGVKAAIDNLKVPVPMFIEDNFTVSTIAANISDYQDKAGEPLTTTKGYSSECSGSYIYDYAMNYSSKIKVTDVDFGAGSEAEVGADLITVKYFGDKDTVTPVFTTNPDTAALGKVLYELSATADFSDSVTEVNVAEIKVNKIATLYLRAYYKGNPNYETVYQLKVIAATPVDFDISNGFEFAGKTFKFEDTAVFVYETELEDDGNYYGYGFLGDEYYRFKVDNKLVFDSMSMLETQMTGVIEPNVLLPGAEYGEYTFTYAANYYGANAGLNPVDKSQSQTVTGEDWTLNAEWGKYSDTAFDVIYFADGLEGKIYLNGITVRGQVNDTLRTMGKDGKAYGSLDIEFENLVVAHIRGAEFADARNGGLINRQIGSTTADKVFNLINTRSVNSDNTQVEFIENQYMDIDYADFNETYTDSFSIKNAYISDIRNANYLFNDYVPAHMTVDGLYMDMAALGDTVDNLIGNFKTGAAVKTGSFAFINSNIRNANTGSVSANLSIQGPTGDAASSKLADGYAYNVSINGNIFYNSLHNTTAAKSAIIVAPSMISALEIKENYAFQTGNNAKSKAFIRFNDDLKDANSDPALAIIGNINVDGNSFVGYDSTDLAFDLGLGDNDPTIKNTFASDDDEAHLTTDLVGEYYAVMGSENYYLDFAKTVASASVLITGTTVAEGGDFRDIVIAGQDVTMRIYGGTLADLTFTTAAGAAEGKWATNAAGTRAQNASRVTPASIGAGKSKTYYFIYSYTHEGVAHKYSYKVTIESCVDCSEHVWKTEGTFNNDATCLQNGTQVVKCSTAGCIATAVVEKPDSKAECIYDNYVANNDATCVKVGTETGTCIWCGTENTRENATLYPENKTAHKWGAYVYNNDATCAKDGTETSVCEDNCGASQTRTSAEHLKSTVAHTWGEYTYDGTATCQHNGTKTAMCTVDGCRVVNTIDDPNFPASEKNHVWGEYVYNKDATKTADGTQTATCALCGKTNTVTAVGTKLAVTIEDSSKTFKDVKSTAWYKAAVDYVTSHGFMNGTTTTVFGIGQNVERGMFVTILARMAGVDTTSKGVNNVATKFTDVASGKYYTAAIKWASDNNIVNGTGKTTFSPTEKISRQDLCVMVVRFAEFKGIKLLAKEKEMTFTDASQISNYAKAAVKTCQMADIVNGHTSGAFAPRDTATREEAAQILYTLHKNFMA